MTLWLVVSLILLAIIVVFTYYMVGELRLQKLLHAWKGRDWRYDG